MIFHDYEEFYEKEYGKKQYTIESKKTKPDLRIINGDIIEGKRILVLGCGCGDDVAFLTGKNEVYGIDILSNAVDSACRKGIKAIKVNIEKGLPYPSRYFDIVICKHVLEHLFNPLYVANEICRVLNRDGYAIISVPNHFWLPMRLRILFGKSIILPGHNSEEWNYFHLRFFTFKGFNNFLKKAKLKPVKFYWAQGPYACSLPSFLRKVLERVISLRPSLLSPEFYCKVILGECEDS
jgi:methionine biosynthesis protein MetW